MRKRVGILGGAGYTAGELLRVLLFHPEADVVRVHSQSQAGKPVATAHPDLLGETNLVFTDAYDYDNLDVLFLCVGHGEAARLLTAHPVPASVRIVDLSQDFRLSNPDHDFVYGLPELNRARIMGAARVANPGCFATAIQLALLPLATGGHLATDVHVTAITGSTGAGQAPSSTTHFSWRSNNVSVYKAFAHQHLGEIGQSVRQLQPDFGQRIHFVPVRGNFTRGILASVYTHFEGSLADAQQLFDQYYAAHPFVHRTAHNPALKEVVGTSKGLLYLEKHDDQLLIVSLIDNLLKGASGQAVQNFNLMCGLPETCGLRLRALAF